MPLCQQYGVAILPWSPLAGGILAGRYSDRTAYPEGSRAERMGSTFRDRITQKALDVAQKMGDLAAERGMTVSQLALLWCKEQPGITSPIIGPRTMAHFEDALGIIDATLSAEDRTAFDELVHPGTAVADFHNSNDWMKARVFD